MATQLDRVLIELAAVLTLTAQNSTKMVASLIDDLEEEEDTQELRASLAAIQQNLEATGRDCLAMWRKLQQESPHIVLTAQQLKDLAAILASAAPKD